MSDENTTPQTAVTEQATTSNPEPASASEAPAASEPSSPKPTETVEFWRAKSREWETRSKENADKAKQFDELTAKSKSDLERAQDEAQRLSDRLASYRDRAVRGEAKALAADFANPDVAVRLLGDLQGYVDDSGDIDTERLSSDLGDLLKREPYLGRAQEPTGMRPNPAQGQSSNPALTPTQLATERERAGDWKGARAVKADQLLQLAKNNK